jgi:nickel transport system substrate-binding protein
MHNGGKTMKFNKMVVNLFAIIVIITLLSACTSNNNNKSIDNSGAEAEVKQELVYATTKDINDMNPHLYAGSMPAQGMIYESLVENTKEGIKPLLAKSWEISEDGKSYTFI